MTANAFPAFDPALATAQLWVDELAARLGPNRRRAWGVLTVVLRDLRDRLPAGAAAALGARLPLIVRGAFYEDYQPTRTALSRRAPDPWRWERLDTATATKAVFDTLIDQLGAAELAFLQQALPPDLRSVWAAAVAGAARFEPWRNTEHVARPSRPPRAPADLEPFAT